MPPSRHGCDAAEEQEYQERVHVEQEAAAPLVGYHGRTNALNGYPVAQPLAITTNLPPHVEGVVRRPAIGRDSQLLLETAAGVGRKPK